jgi:hypothetical protein
MASWHDFDSIPSFSSLWSSLRSIGVSSFLNVWWSSAVNPSGPGLFFVGRLYITTSISLLVIDLFMLFIAFWFSYDKPNPSRNLCISFRFSTLL